MVAKIDTSSGNFLEFFFENAPGFMQALDIRDYAETCENFSLAQVLTDKVYSGKFGDSIGAIRVDYGIGIACRAYNLKMLGNLGKSRFRPIYAPVSFESRRLISTRLNLLGIYEADFISVVGFRDFTCKVNFFRNVLPYISVVLSNQPPWAELSPSWIRVLSCIRELESTARNSSSKVFSGDNDLLRLSDVKVERSGVTHHQVDLNADIDDELEDYLMEDDIEEFTDFI